MRTRIPLLAIAAAAMLLTAPGVRAQDSGSSAWNGSSLTMPASSDSGVVHVVAYFTRSPARTINFLISASGDAPSGCSMPNPAASSGRTPASFATDLTFQCNGTYSVLATAHTTDDNAVVPHDSAARSGTVAVAMPAPTVTGVSASGDGRSITVVWDPMTSVAPDLSGYVVERQIDGGPFTEVASVAANETTFVDESLPAQAGEATYRVISIRPSPEGTKVSAAANSEATPFVADPSAPTTSIPGDGTTGDGTTGDGTTGDGTTPGAGDGTGSGGTGDGSAPGTTAPNAPGTGGPSRPGIGVRVPRLGLTGTFLPPLLRPSASMSPPTTIDGGFSDRLPYDEVEPGEDDPVLPDDELASIFTDGEAGRGMAIPIATALVLAVWAFHLRFLARASRPIQ